MNLQRFLGIIKDNSPPKFANLLRRLKKAIFFSRPRRWISSSEYARHRGAKWYLVYPSTPSRPSPGLNYGSISVDHEKYTVDESPEKGVLELKNALVYGVDGWVVTQDGYLLSDVSNDSASFSNFYSQKVWPRFIPRPKRLQGVCLSIVGFGGSHYGHWLIESIPKIDLFLKSGFDFNDVDYILCSKPLPGTPLNLFKMLNIPFEKCVWAEVGTAFHVDTLLSPSFPGILRGSIPWVPTFLQNSFLTASSDRPSRRLYLSRSGYKSRNPVNCESVDKILARYNFEAFNPEAHPASHQVFAEASIVIGASGSALTGLVFCQPGTKVLELVPSDMMKTCHYLTVADAAGLIYSYLVCKSVDHREESLWGATPYDFYVNELEFERALIKLTSES